MDAKQLFRAYSFDEAASSYKDQLSKGFGDEWANLDGLGKALMASAKYAEAIPYLERVGQHERGVLAGAAGQDIPISVCHWVLGDREQGLKIIKALVVAVRDHVITYTDLAGGVSQGIILCYMAAALQRQDDVKLALKFLTDRAKNRIRITSWPGPAALLLLGKATFEESVQNATGAADVGQAKQIAEADLLKRRQLTNILFTAALERRLAGDEAKCGAYMAECASLTNPLIEYEWHLARKEVFQ